ncbi:MAG: Hsp20/alpha crystallin family protein [Bacteroidota bacterium]|jgi:HSP20 family protein|nr:Hsp20/alpha crystallin family protein [Algoriphagus sp.]
MSLVTTRKNGGRAFPSLASEFFNPDRWFGSSLLDFDGNLFTPDTWGMMPGANISENEKAYTIELAVPGLEKKDFKVEVHDGVLSISGEKEEEKSEEDKNYRRQEFSYHSFSRSFTLPDNLLVDKIDAAYAHGILKLTLPKKELTVSKPVKQIKVG